MEGALLILGFLVAVGVVLYVLELGYRRKHKPGSVAADELPHTSGLRPQHSVEGATGGETKGRLTGEQTGEQGGEPAEDRTGEQTGEAVEAEAGAECCGLHLVCEKDSLSPMSGEVIYYDDEELDRFVGRPGNDYSSEETEEFREVLMTLRPEDVAGWARSITTRSIELPPDVRDELLMLVNEQREAGR